MIKANLNLIRKCHNEQCGGMVYLFDVGLKGLLMQRGWLMLRGLMMLRVGKQIGLAGLSET